MSKSKITQEMIENATKMLRFAASYHEKLLSNGYKIRGYFHRKDIGDALSEDVTKGLTKIVIIPACLVPEDLIEPSGDKKKVLRFRNQYYVRYLK